MELHLLPIRQLLDKQVQETAVQLMTGPTVGQPKLDRTPEEMKLGGKTPMELHAQKGCLKLNAGEYWERRMAFITAPWEQPPIVHIEEKEQAINRHKVIEKQYKGRKGSLLVYTDGSAHGGHVGAAAVIGNSSKHRQLYMGLETQSTVYAAELQGIRMGLLPAVHDARVRELFIFTDN